MALLLLMLLPAAAIDLKRINLANSGIESIEHITMNPSPEQYKEYYGDYIDLSTFGEEEPARYQQEEGEDYDHVGNMMDYFDEKFVYPTLGKEELNLSIGPMALTVAEIGDFTREYGTYIGDLKAHSHGIRGHVYIVDKNHLFIRKFSYDGGGSLDAYFWVGSDHQPSPKGQVVPYPPHEGFDSKTNRPLPIREMRGQNVLLPLPKGRYQNAPMDVSEIKWLSIWCTRFTVNLAEIFLPLDPKVPRPMSLEKFPAVPATDLTVLRSDTVQILDKKTFYIPNFHLFVDGERGFRFQASRRDQDHKFNIDIPNENNRYDDLVDYNGRDVMISLPSKTTVYDIRYFAVVNTIRGQNVLGKIHIPSEMELEGWPVPPARGQHQQWWPEPTRPAPAGRPTRRPASTTSGYAWARPTEPPPERRWSLPNCREFLGRKVRVLWESRQDEIYFRVQAKTREDEFAALGFVPQGARKESDLTADYVKIYINSSSQSPEFTFRAADAFQSEARGCTLASGLCEDENHRRDGQNVILVEGANRKSDISTVDFIKPRSAKDEFDTDISRNSETMVLIAIASLNGNLRNKAMVSGENESIDFNAKESTKCFDVPPVDEVESVKWSVQGAWPRKIPMKMRNFEVRLGPPGGDKGYKRITGQDPPFIGMCWWINGWLLPELTVHRGQTYYFKVQGGDTERLGSINYHPFYITSSRDGGYGKKIETERNGERIWAGVEGRYEPKPTAKGSLCYFKAREGEDKWREAETFREYKDSLEIVCEWGKRDQYGLLNWTVAEDTPPIVYYQSYTYEGLGWKINVLDDGESCAPPPAGLLLPLILFALWAS